MLSKWQWLWRQLSHTLWIRVALFALLGVLGAAFAGVVQYLVAAYAPESLPALLDASAVGPILNIIASSMLAVTTFSLSVMVSAYSGATTNVTPRATTLLLADTTSQNVLGTFIGSFLFALVGIIALNTESYNATGRLVLFTLTLIVIIVIVMTLIRWFQHLIHFGRMADTCERVEQAALGALAERCENPTLGARPWLADQPLPESAQLVCGNVTGYIQHLDTHLLNRLAVDHDVQVFVQHIPGAFVYPHTPLLQLAAANTDSEPLAADTLAKFSDAFRIGDCRSFEQDPRFGLIVLSEIASRALSPAVNDPGTAIDIIGRGVRLLQRFAGAELPTRADQVAAPQVWVKPLAAQDLCDDFFAPIIRDGANLFEVQIRVSKALRALHQLPNSELREALLRQQARVTAIAESWGDSDQREALQQTSIDRAAP